MSKLIADVDLRELPAQGRNAVLSFRDRLPALDGLRGVAILLVFFHHYAGNLSIHTHSARLRVMGVPFGMGWTGVDLFFVLSGFLITGILYDTRNDPLYYRNFYFRRALRILPVYYLVIVFCVLYGAFAGIHWATGHLFFIIYLGYPAALIWPSLVHFSSVIGVNHLWSLSLEEQFYMVWPWAIAKMRNPRAILRGCLFLGGAAFLLRVLIAASGWPGPDWFYTFLPCRADELALGAAVAVLIREGQAERLQRWAPLGLLVAAGITAAVCLGRHSVDHNDPLIGTIGYDALAVGYAFLLVLCLKSGTWVQRVCSCGGLRLFGKYSYGLYVYHYLLLQPLTSRKDAFVAWTHSFVLGSVLYLLICLSLSLSLAVISFHCFESPLMSLKKRFSYRGPKEPVFASSSVEH